MNFAKASLMSLGPPAPRWTARAPRAQRKAAASRARAAHERLDARAVDLGEAELRRGGLQLDLEGVAEALARHLQLLGALALIRRDLRSSPREESEPGSRALRSRADWGRTSWRSVRCFAIATVSASAMAAASRCWAPAAALQKHFFCSASKTSPCWQQLSSSSGQIRT